MKRGLIALLVVMALMLLPYGTALAATTQNVEITATPSYISISNSPDNYGFGVVSAGTNYSTAQGCFTVTNPSTVNIDVSIGTNNTNWVGTTNWTHADGGTPDADEAALFSSQDTGAFDIIVKFATPNDIVSDQAATTDFDWELRLVSPTSFSDGSVKAIKVVLTASAT